MVVSIRNALIAGVALGALHTAAGAVQKQAQLPLDVNAASSEIDYKNKTIFLKKVRIAQGDVVVTADQGQASGTSPDAAFDNNRWVFRGTVKMTMEDGVLNADEAQLTIKDRVLTLAVATGKPATFQQRIAKTDKLAKGHADNIEYDVPKGMVHLTGSGWLLYDQTEMSGESIRYDVNAQVVKGVAEEQNNKQLHFIYTPKNQPAVAPGAPAAPSAPASPTP